MSHAPAVAASPLTIVPILATPLGMGILPEGAGFNAALAALIEARAAADRRPQRSALCYLGEENLLDWPEAPVQDMLGAIVRRVYDFVASLNEFPAGQLESFRIEARGRAVIVRPNGAMSAVQHALTAWCAVYCVAAPPPTVERADNGAVRLYESRLGTMFSDATTATMRLPYLTGHCAWRPEPGGLLLFPASLTHEVAPLRATANLVLATLRIRFVAPGQTGVGRW
jgi:hypothetical protein